MTQDLTLRFIRLRSFAQDVYVGAGTQGKEQEKPTYKPQLDQAAREARNPGGERQSGLAQKITEYIPGAAKILDTGAQDKPEEKHPTPHLPPRRPDHDPHIEEFVRDQHRSKHQHLEFDNP
ncbi:hypothetical protein DL762_008042 [Monosporascus cannonballus]|uniref:Uncharacterized protein n=1 Tax=Monosporascus cannonballus TaxID=155416 RepID=A0ABY0GXC2_9PEZI|nr:hypothetical protein DL762_008042 [Monosporascus cannonballus]